ncbi:ABATE domain-containing protein [Streptomyces sp. RKAG290]|uniref:CGNR zinc finger domain-containing protein n=1 Tax=Streptomyces sp. RKAG290 TaxID=2888348 RepID=UPI0020345041|nr:ABATE domain-containing protein [Streptomyces sp. RKAG290]MCM2416246.1 ABATE domain-containing protein [Streptomyces sp. RKAG290]
MALIPEPATPRFRSGAGRLCLDFMRTLRLRGMDGANEELVTAHDLADWVAQLGPFPADVVIPAPTQAVLGEARALREAVHGLLTAARGEGGPATCPQADRELLNAAAAGAPPAPLLDDDGGVVWTAEDLVGTVLADIARDAITLATSPAMARVRACSGPHCAAWFLDTSRPGNRRWCSMETCGNKSKKSTWRTRHVTTAGA